MIAICTRCRTIYEASDSEPLQPTHTCPRCSAVAELLAAADALNARIKRELGEPRWLRVAVVQRSKLMPLMERTERAVEKMRALP